MNKRIRKLSFATRNIAVSVLVLLVPSILFACNEDRPHTPLSSRAADSGDLPGIRFDGDGSDPAIWNGMSPDVPAAREGHLEAIRSSVRTSAAQGFLGGILGWTPSSLAAREGQLSTSVGGTPLLIAVPGVVVDRFALGSCQTETVRILADHSPGLRLPDHRSGRSAALGTANFFGSSEVVGLEGGSSDQARSRTATDEGPSSPQGETRSV